MSTPEPSTAATAAEAGASPAELLHPCNVCGLNEAAYALMALDDDTSGLFCGDCLVGTFTAVHAQQGATS